jgi:tetratricopeptide (TPR) repeat protein
MVTTLDRGGDHDRAVVVARRAVTTSRTALGDWRRTQALGQVAQALVGIGEPELAEAIAPGTVVDLHDDLAAAIASVAMAAQRDPDRAVALTDAAQRLIRRRAGSYRAAQRQVHELAALARALGPAASSPAVDRKLTELAAEAQQLAESISRGAPGWENVSVQVFEAAKASADAGEVRHAVRLAGRVEQHWLSTARDDDQAQALAVLAGALIDIGRLDQALTTAERITHPRYRVEVETRLVLALAAAGRHDAALELAAQTEQLTAALREARVRVGARADLAAALVAVGEPDRAAALFDLAEQEAPDPNAIEDRPEAFTRLAVALHRAGLTDRTVAAARAADRAARRSGKFVDLDLRSMVWFRLFALVVVGLIAWGSWVAIAQYPNDWWVVLIFAGPMAAVFLLMMFEDV